jgi:hypothetical protein
MCDTELYMNHCILLPSEENHFEFKTIGTTTVPPSISIEYDETTMDYFYTLIFTNEDGKEKVYSFSTIQPLLDDKEFEYPTTGKRFVLHSKYGLSVLNEEDRTPEMSDYTCYFTQREGRKFIEPEEQFKGKQITIMTCFTNLNNFGTKYINQRIYFFIDGVKYPFETFELCCNI